MRVPASDEVQLWQVELGGQAADSADLLALLSGDERARAARFHFRRDRDRFVAARGLLRRILADYLDLVPNAIRFAYGPYGKPALAGDLALSGLRFNLSHADDIALCAVTRDREVGVDIERLRTDLDAAALAKQFFSHWEIAALRALPPALQDAAFFACWTRKEAYIKARGEGLSLPLDHFDVTVAPEEPPRLHVEGAPEEAARWSLHRLAAPPGYAAALAVQGHDVQISSRRWEDTAGGF